MQPDTSRDASAAERAPEPWGRAALVGLRAALLGAAAWAAVVYAGRLAGIDRASEHYELLKSVGFGVFIFVANVAQPRSPGLTPRTTTQRARLALVLALVCGALYYLLLLV